MNAILQPQPRRANLLLHCGAHAVDNTGSLVGVAGATYREGQNLNFARSVLDLAAIWHGLRAQTFDEVANERSLEFLKSELANKYFTKYRTNSLRERARLALAIREAFPDLAVSYECTAQALIDGDDYQHALAELEQARLLLVDTERDWTGLGELYTRIGHTDRAQECLRRAKQLRDAEAKKSTSPPDGLKLSPTGSDKATETLPGASVTRVNGADCHIIKYKAGWKEGDLINTRTGPGQNYSVENKIAIGEKGLVMEFQTTSNKGTPWVRVFRWDNNKKDSATFIGWANKSFFQFDR